MKSKIAVIAISHSDTPNLYLHGLRRDDSSWSLPGGHMHPGETPLEAARRELKEETGLDNVDLEGLSEKEYETEDGPLHVYLFGGKHPNVKPNSEEDPDGEFLAFKFMDPSSRANWHVPKNRNILNEHLSNLKELSGLEKMSRPVISFPKLGLPTRMDSSVKPIETGNQKEMIARQSVNHALSHLPESIKDKFRSKMVNTIKRRTSKAHGQAFTTPSNTPAGWASAGKLRHVDPKDAREVQTTNELAAKIRVKYGIETPKVAEESSIKGTEPSRKRRNQKKTENLPKEQQILRGKGTEQTIAHEATHNLFAHLRAKHGNHTINRVQRELIDKSFDPETVNHLQNFLRHHKYSPTKSLWHEEMITAARDITVNPAKRVIFKKLVGDEKFDDQMKKVKSGWQRLVNEAKNIGPEVFKKSESLSKAPLIYHNPAKSTEVIRVQNEAGEGPYQEFDWEDEDKPHDSTTGRPAIQEDKGFLPEDKKIHAMRQSGQFASGFENKEQMNKWFSQGELKRLAERGFAPTKVKTNKVWSSGKQTFFEKIAKPHRMKKVLGKSEDFMEPLIKTIGQAYKQIANSSVTLLHPVSIGDRHNLIDNIPLHITSKIFGPEDSTDLSEVHKRIAPFEDHIRKPIDTNTLRILPHKFTGRNGDIYHVLLLHGMPSHLTQLYENTRDLGKDFVHKDFAPHITVDKELWNKVNEGHLQPKDIGLKIHPAELKVGGKTEKTY